MKVHANNYGSHNTTQAHFADSSSCCVHAKFPIFPPSTGITCPCILPLYLSLARKIMVLATSSGGTGLAGGTLHMNQHQSKPRPTEALNSRSLTLLPFPFRSSPFALPSKSRRIDRTRRHGIDTSTREHPRSIER